MAHSFPPRKLHVIDIENLCGLARPTPDVVQSCRSGYADLVGVGGDDLVIVGCNHGALLTVGCAWPHVRLLMRSGPNGADLALLNVLDCESVETRFDAVVIGSGDGIFTNSAARLAASGCQVTVVSRPESLSRRLALAATRVEHFTTLPAPAPPAVRLVAA